VDPEVREAYLKGRLFLESPTEEQTRKAIQSFEQAVHKDPGDASAYAGLARAYGAASNVLVRPRQAIPPAKAAALKALALDSSLAEAYTSRGLLRAAFDWDLPGSESDLRHALEIDPGDAPARLYLGIVLLVRGRQEEGLSEVERAQRQDPLSTKINSRLGMIYALLGQHAKSLRQCRKALELDRNSAEGHTCLGYAFERKGRYRDAIEEYERANDLGYRASPHIARVAALAGHKAEATRRLRRLKQEWQQGEAWSPYEIARVCRALGDDDQTFAWLETAYEERDQTLVGLLADPDWDGLRSDRRFVALAQRIGLRR
jgi:tetratricopeptide (TPR) repeat protein